MNTKFGTYIQNRRKHNRLRSHPGYQGWQWVGVGPDMEVQLAIILEDGITHLWRGDSFSLAVDRAYTDLMGWGLLNG